MSVPEEATGELESKVPENRESDLESGQTIVEPASMADERVKDPNIVDWDGPDDPENPLNWSSFVRMMHVVLVSVFTLYA